MNNPCHPGDPNWPEPQQGHCANALCRQPRYGLSSFCENCTNQLRAPEPGPNHTVGPRYANFSYEEPCGCIANVYLNDKHTGNNLSGIVYCPKHAAAGELLTALQRIASYPTPLHEMRLAEYGGDPKSRATDLELYMRACSQITTLYSIALDALNAIAKAEKRP